MPKCECPNEFWACMVCDPEGYRESLIADHADFLNDQEKENRDLEAEEREDWMQKEAQKNKGFKK